ncbi:hypothetical protein Tco_0558799 [Tanacetum coccineum]
MNNSVTIAYRFKITLQLCLFDGSKPKNNDELQQRLSNFFKNFDSNGGGDLCYQGGLDQRFIFFHDRRKRMFLNFWRIIRLSTPGEYGTHMLSLSLRKRRRVSPIGIGENTNPENFGFDILQIGWNLLHDVHTLACHRSGGF